jgi:Fur family zinc uptake transcriptional regulator
MTTHHHASPPVLTKNQNLVFGALSHAEGPLSAYAILDQLRDDGFRAPLQVYRALDKLIELGLIHRLESLNSFVACQHPECEDRESMVFAICETCGKVSELADDHLEKQLKLLAKRDGFSVKTCTIELRGNCHGCGPL